MGLLSAAVPSTAQLPPTPPKPDAFTPKSRVFVLTDIGNEPDDQMSFVRLIAYANAIDIEGIAATTSVHLRNTTNPKSLHDIVDDYLLVRPNLLKHATGWPTAATMHARISSGPTHYGMAGIDAAQPSSGAIALIAATDKLDGRPLWVSIWGGANTLAEALSVVHATRSAQQTAQFVSRLRVYSISDQDDAGPWIRTAFPLLRYVVSPTLPDVFDYGSATWSGISGDRFYLNGDGADSTTVTEPWLGDHVRQGPLGRHYLKAAVIMEGDTPAFLGLIPNGLNSAMSPGWGGWGGRYVWRPHAQAGGPIWTQGVFPVFGVDSRDQVAGADGRLYRSDQATIWRWRTAFQHDFAARMDWTIKPFDQANHAPIAVVNGDKSLAPVRVRLSPGVPITLDASQSSDPDKGQQLHYRWFMYREVERPAGPPLPELVVEGENTSRMVVKDGCQTSCRGGMKHVILEITDNGSPALTSYRRIVVETGTPGH